MSLPSHLNVIESDAKPALDDIKNIDVAENPWIENCFKVERSEGWVETAECKLKFYRWGDRSKPGIIMQHGFLAHSRCFAFIAPFLAEHFHIVAYDHSGMGDSGWRDVYSEEIRVQEMLDVCQATGLFDDGKKPFAIAHSFGGRIATAALHANPNLFAGVIICDLMIIRPSILKKHADKFGPPGGKRDTSKPNRIYSNFAAARERFILSPPQKVEHRELEDYMALHSLNRVDGGWQWKFDPRVFNVMSKSPESWISIGESVASLKLRSAIVYGEKSILFTADSVNYMQELALENGHQAIPCIAVPQARHHIMLDQPLALVVALQSILTQWQTQDTRQSSEPFVSS